MNVNEAGNGQDRSGINGIVLSPALMSALFAEVLVPLTAAPADRAAPRKTSAPPAAVPDPGPATAPEIMFAGENRRNICLLVAVPGKEVLPAKTMSFLEKMLGACQLSTQDLAIVNTRLSPAGTTALISRFAPVKWLVAGPSPASLGIEVPDTHFQVHSWQGNPVLSMPSLAEMDQDSPSARQLKRQLWTGLQQLFEL